MQEFELIELVTKRLASNGSVVAGPGDDCAVLDLGTPGEWVLFKTDAVVEGIHFTQEATPESIGHKALGRCLSDIAAMAGRPTAALVTIGLPKQFEPPFVERIYGGMNTLAKRYETAIVGGETTTNPDRIFISIALVGTVKRGQCILRSGAQEGDGIFVTGELGGSLQEKHLTFEPRVNEALWLAEHFQIHAMIDVSDGLAGDLPHILKASGKGAELFSKCIPISRIAKLRYLAAQEIKAEGETKTSLAGAKLKGPVKAPLEAALTDGEDFELLFTLPRGKAVPLVDAWKAKFPELKLTCIGKITPEPGLRIRTNRELQSLEAHGYIHFKES